MLRFLLVVKTIFPECTGSESTFNFEQIKLFFEIILCCVLNSIKRQKDISKKRINQNQIGIQGIRVSNITIKLFFSQPFKRFLFIFRINNGSSIWGQPLPRGQPVAGGQQLDGGQPVAGGQPQYNPGQGQPNYQPPNHQPGFFLFKFFFFIFSFNFWWF